MATTKQVRNAIRSAARSLSVDLPQTTYTDAPRHETYKSFRYVCFPMWSTSAARKVAQEANFILFAMTGETNVVRVAQTAQQGWRNTGRPYIRANATLD